MASERHENICLTLYSNFLFKDSFKDPMILASSSNLDASFLSMLITGKIWFLIIQFPLFPLTHQKLVCTILLVDVKCNWDGQLELTQQGLIKKIIFVLPLRIGMTRKLFVGSPTSVLLLIQIPIHQWVKVHQ